MKKIMNSKGFTLVELMMVIAIIAILALVLIPKAAFMKQSAKDAGLETNIRVVEATATNLLPKFTSLQLAEFNNMMRSKLTNNVKNPFTQDGTCTVVATAVVPGSSDVGVYGIQGGSSATYTGAADNTALKGVVIFHAYTSGSAIQCDIWGYDGSGFKSNPVHQVN